MRQLYWTILELKNLAGRELCALADQLLELLQGFEPGSVERYYLLISLANIRRVQARRRAMARHNVQPSRLMPRC